MPNNATVVNLPTDVTDEKSLRLVLTRVTEELDKLLGYRTDVESVNQRFDSILARIDLIERRLLLLETTAQENTNDVSRLRSTTNKLKQSNSSST